MSSVPCSSIFGFIEILTPLAPTIQTFVRGCMSVNRCVVVTCETSTILPTNIGISCGETVFRVWGMPSAVSISDKSPKFLCRACRAAHRRGLKIVEPVDRSDKDIYSWRLHTLTCGTTQSHHIVTLTTLTTPLPFLLRCAENMASENLSRIRSNEILPSEAMLATGAQTQRRTSTCRSIAEEKEEEKGGTSDLSDDGRGDITEEEWTYPDGGFRAWLVVLGCFMMACSCMYVNHTRLYPRSLVDLVFRGWGLVWGVVQDYYHTNMFPETSLSVLSLAGGLMNFVRMISFISLLLKN